MSTRIFLLFIQNVKKCALVTLLSVLYMQLFTIEQQLLEHIIRALLHKNYALLRAVRKSASLILPNIHFIETGATRKTGSPQ